MNYVRNGWYVAGWTPDMEAEKPVAVSILGEPIVVYRAESGRLTALADRCVHRMAPLSLGRCEGENLRCMYHGLLFDPAGSVIEIPGQDKIPAQAKVRAYPVADRHSWIWVWMGDPAQADPALIPPAVGLDDPDYILGRGHLDYAAEARLINDNLLDFSHLSYVHANSFGATEDWAKDRPRVIPLPRGVRVERWLTDQPGMRGRPKTDQLQDRWSTYDFLIPGILLMTGGSYPQGTAAKLGFAPPDLADAKTGVTFTSQAVTPTAAGKARYFFSWGPRRDCGDEAMRDMLMGIADQAFGEDKLIIEAQQRVIDGAADPQVMPTTADKALILFNRLVDGFIRAENETRTLAA